MTRTRWYFLLLLTVFSSLLSLGAPATQVSAALSASEKQQCYDKFNAKDIIRGNLSIADQILYDKCRSEGWCFDAGEAATIGARRITCSNPTLTSASANAADAEVAPLVKLVCGNVPSSETLYDNYIRCGDNVRKIYADCDMTGTSVTSAIEDTNENTARCVRDRLSSPKPTPESVLAAVTAGRNSAKAIVQTAVDDIALERKKQECLARPVPHEWVNNDCQPIQGSASETCRIDGIGWIVCPLITFLTKITDGAYTAAEQLLIFTIPNPFETDPVKNPLYSLWSSVRNLANIAFVLAFFAVIFSQATSMGISAYGIRKILPRMVVAAILVNLSYYICVFAIDISNIIGGGLDDLISALPAGAITEAGTGDGTWEKVGASILSFTLAGATAVAVAYLATGTFFALLAFSFLAIITAVAIFMARHALIIMLIILSPLAFVAYILPNTENLFDKWKKAFIAMLVMYPLVAMLFAGSKAASSIMLATAGGDSAGGTGGNFAWLYKIAALGVLAIPLFGIPWIVKFSGGFIGRVAGMVNDRSKGMVDRARKLGDEGAKERRARTLSDARTRSFGKRWGKDTDGKDIDSRSAAFKRRLGRGVGRVANPVIGGTLGTGSRKLDDSRREREFRMGEVQRERDHSYFNRLGDRDESGNLTPNAQRMTQRAGGVGGAAGARRAAQTALEKQLQHSAEERKREMLFQSVNGFHGKGTYFVFDDNNPEKVVSVIEGNTGAALAEAAKGKKIGVVAAGKSGYDGDGNINYKDMKIIDSRPDEHGGRSASAQAALERLAQTGDGAGIGYLAYGNQYSARVVNDEGKVTQQVKSTGSAALDDAAYDDWLQFAGDNFSSMGTKFAHYFRADDAISGENGGTVLQSHGNALRAKASRIVQIREQAKQIRDKYADNPDAQVRAAGLVNYADQLEEKLISAWNSGQQDPNQKQYRSKKKNDDFRQAVDILEGRADRYVLREFGETTEDFEAGRGVRQEALKQTAREVQRPDPENPGKTKKVYEFSDPTESKRAVKETYYNPAEDKEGEDEPSQAESGENET